jgi:hypothetical protein
MTKYFGKKNEIKNHFFCNVLKISDLYFCYFGAILGVFGDFGVMGTKIAPFEMKGAIRTCIYKERARARYTRD